MPAIASPAGLHLLLIAAGCHFPVRSLELADRDVLKICGYYSSVRFTTLVLATHGMAPSECALFFENVSNAPDVKNAGPRDWN